MKGYEPNDNVTGIVTGVENYGIFLALEGDYTGLIHISELSEHFVKDVKDYAKIGEEITCRVLECDTENKKLKCSIRNTEYGEWKDSMIDHGFAPLKKRLPIWMEEKLNEMDDSNAKVNNWRNL